MTLAFGTMMALFLLAGALRMPIGMAMLVSGILYFHIAGRDVGLASEQILNNLFNSFVLLAVPLFIFAANVMNAGTISERLFDFATLIVGRLRGGLAHVNVITSLIFSGMSGSAIADAAGVGKLMIAMMVRGGRYAPGFAAALTAASATIGPIIPPSIPMVIYALVADTSVGYLFLGGIVPGLLMAGTLMTMVAVMGRRRDFPVEPLPDRARLPATIVHAVPVLLLPVILLGGIYSGAVTPTEAAAVAAAYALLLALVVYRSLPLSGLIEVLVDSARSTGVVTLIIAGAFVFNYVVASERIPMHFAAWLGRVDIDPVLFLLGVNVAFLLFGCFLDAITMLLILVPLLMPSVRTLGIDTVHFGVVIVVNMMIGLVTPPYGVLLFVISGLTGIRLGAIIREIVPFIVVLVAALVLMVVFPDIVLWAPRQFGYRG
jgi:TRAP-type transport system large permease protein